VLSELVHPSVEEIGYDGKKQGTEISVGNFPRLNTEIVSVSSGRVKV
jgi:hypothetical protein